MMRNLASLTNGVRDEQAQATLELTVVLILIMLLMVAMVKIFAWVNLSMIERQKSYNDTRIAAGNMPEGSVSSVDPDTGILTESPYVSDSEIPMVGWNEPNTQLNIFE